MYDHDAFLRKWMQRSGMLTAPVGNENALNDEDVFSYSSEKSLLEKRSRSIIFPENFLFSRNNG